MKNILFTVKLCCHKSRTNNPIGNYDFFKVYIFENVKIRKLKMKICINSEFGKLEE